MPRIQRRFAAAILLALFAGCALAADTASPVVRDYEARLEEISKEIQEIRRQLDVLVEDVVEGETGRVFIFLEGPAPTLKDAGFTLAVNGKTVVARPFTAGEADALARGLPLELLDVRLPAGEHRVALAPGGAALPEPALLSAAKGRLSSWIAKPGASGFEWRSE